MKIYTQEEIKRMAHEFLNAVKSKTGWRINGVVYTNLGAKPYLNVQAPGWSNGTELDDYARRIDENAQKKLDDYLKIEEAFNRKYKDIGFSVSGSSSGERVASDLSKIANDMVNMNIRKEIVKLASELSCGDEQIRWKRKG